MSKDSGYKLHIGGKKVEIKSKWEAEARRQDLYDSGEWEETQGWAKCLVDIKKRGDEYWVRLVLTEDQMVEFGEFLGMKNASTISPSILLVDGVEVKCLMCIFDIEGVILQTPISDEQFDVFVEQAEEARAKREEAN